MMIFLALDGENIVVATRCRRFMGSIDYVFNYLRVLFPSFKIIKINFHIRLSSFNPFFSHLENQMRFTKCYNGKGVACKLNLYQAQTCVTKV